MTPSALQTPASPRARSPIPGRWAVFGFGPAVLAALLALALLAGTARADDDVVASRHVSAPPDVVWAQLTDFDSWTAMFPAIESLDHQRLGEHRERLRTANRVAGHTVRYTLLATADPSAHRLECHLDPSEPGDMEQLDSTWEIAPERSGGSRVELRVRSRSGRRIPSFIERLWARRSARQSVDALAYMLARHPRVARTE